MTPTTKRSDLGRSIGAVLGFAAALGATSVLFPLMALDAGFSAPIVGVFTSISAGIQLLARFALPWLLRRLADRMLLVAACVMIAMSAASLVAWPTAVSAFVIAQATQGVARSLFWTASQTHVVRTTGVPVRRLAQVQISSKTGGLVGTAGAGALAGFSFQLALLAVVAAAVLGASSSALMVRHPPYARRSATNEGRGVWRKEGVALGSAVAFAAGGWRGMLDSFVPVVLDAAGMGPARIGTALASAEGTAMIANAWLVRQGVGPVRIRAVVVATLGVMVGAALLPFVASETALAFAVLACSGVGGGMLAVLGPALANSGVGPDDQGTAIAIAGAYRAGSRLVVPSLIAGGGVFLGIPLAMAASAVAMAVPVAPLAGRYRKMPPTT